MLEGSVVIIGDEILAGNVPDANGHLAAARLRAHGITLAGVHVVPDERAPIVGILRTELERPRPRLILTSGGIGSTQDDVTFAAIAEALGRPVRVAQEALARIDDELSQLRERGFAVGEEHRREVLTMVSVPEDAVVLRHSGWICGVRIDVAGGLDEEDGVTIVALPGIPDYFRTVLDDVVVPELLAGRGAPPHVLEVRHGLPELVIGPELSRLSRQWPGVRVGSYPGGQMVVRLSGPEEDVEAAAAQIAARLDEIGGPA